MNQMTRNYGKFVLLVGPCDYKFGGLSCSTWSTI